jgi:uncharacterized protein YbjT (DUF2867 family)
MDQARTVAVTGATGFVGREVVRQLLDAGFSVRALVRDTAKARDVLATNPRLTLVQGHIHDGNAPAQLVTGADVCINLLGIIREVQEGPYGGQTFARIHVDATQVLLTACAAQGVRRFVQMSALGVAPDGRAAYQRTKFEAELLVRRSGLDWTIIRPGMIHGPQGEFTQMVRGWAMGSISPYWFMPYFTRLVEHDDGIALGRISFEPARVAPVRVEDVARAFVASLSVADSIGEIYNITGPESLGWDKMLTFYSENIPGSSKLPVLGLPGEPHIYVARLAGFLGLGAWLPFDDGMPTMAQEDSTADLTKVRAHLGVQPRGFRESAREYLPLMV